MPSISNGHRFIVSDCNFPLSQQLNLSRCSTLVELSHKASRGVCYQITPIIQFSCEISSAVSSQSPITSVFSAKNRPLPQAFSLLFSAPQYHALMHMNKVSPFIYRRFWCEAVFLDVSRMLVSSRILNVFMK